jgi:hypothetical protein
VPRSENFSSSSVSQLLFSDSFSGAGIGAGFLGKLPGDIRIEREFGFLFPNRHLHRYQHRAEFDLLSFSQVGRLTSVARTAFSSRQWTLAGRGCWKITSRGSSVAGVVRE